MQPTTIYDGVGEVGTSDHHEIDIAREARLVRKLDLYIVPPVMFLYLFSFLDRYVNLLSMLLVLGSRGFIA